MAFTLDLSFVISAISGVATLALALWLMALRAASPLHRSLALLLLLYGFRVGLGALGNQWNAPNEWLRVYFLLALPFAAAHFAIIYLRTRLDRTPRFPWSAPILLFSATAILEALYFFDHSLWRTQTMYGPLMLLQALPETAYAVVALVLARDGILAQGERAKSALLVALGFALVTLYRSLSVAVNAIMAHFWPGDRFGVTADTMNLAVGNALFGVPVLILGAYAMLLWKGRHRSQIVVRHLFLLLLALVSSIAAIIVFWTLPIGDAGTIIRSIAFVWTLSLPLLVTWAIVKHHLFGLEVKIKWTISYGTVAAIILAAFFIVSTVASEFLVERYGYSFGGVAAGLLLFGLAPLKRLGDRVAARAMPGVKPVKQLDDNERRRIYHEQLELAWLDGRLTRKERLLFDRLRVQLGISGEEALALESEVLRAK